jgi:hypothetical protein
LRAIVPANFDEFRADPDQFIDAGDHVVVVGHFCGRAKSGQQFDAPFAQVWAMRTGRAVRFHYYVQADASARAWGVAAPPFGGFQLSLALALQYQTRSPVASCCRAPFLK